jgi:hypothetical protein
MNEHIFLTLTAFKLKYLQVFFRASRICTTTMSRAVLKALDNTDLPNLGMKSSRGWHRRRVRSIKCNTCFFFHFLTSANICSHHRCCPRVRTGVEQRVRLLPGPVPRAHYQHSHWRAKCVQYDQEHCRQVRAFCFNHGEKCITEKSQRRSNYAFS